MRECNRRFSADNLPCWIWSKRASKASRSHTHTNRQTDRQTLDYSVCNTYTHND
jgi:hypothetical protein